MGEMLDKFFYGFDKAVYLFFWKFQNAFTIGVANVCQYLGNTFAFIVYFAASLFLCFPKKTKKYGVAMVVAYLVALLLVNVLIKPGAARQRPYETLKETEFWDTYQTHYFIELFSFHSSYRCSSQGQEKEVVAPAYAYSDRCRMHKDH